MSGVGWTPSNELFVVSDDRVLARYSLTGEVLDGTVCALDVYVTAMRWLAAVKGGQLTADCLALGCSDGSVRLMAGNGRVERVIAGAHTGSVLCVAWSADGSSLLTGGEDGMVKQWSRSGHLRSRLAQVNSAVTSVCWAPDEERFAFTHSRSLQLQSIGASANSAATAAGPASTSNNSSPSSGSRQWVAHSGPVLCSDWHPLSGSLLTGGEDGVYRLWSDEGELLHASRPFDFAVSAVRWAPSGRYFAVGAFNLLALCDAAGWTHSRQRVSTGTLTALDWTADGTHLAGGGSNGCVLLAQLVQRSSDWQAFTCRLSEKNSLIITDLGLGGGVAGAEVADSVCVEELDFPSPVIEWSFAHSVLVVLTARACHVYKAPHFASACVVELKGAVELLLQSEKAFALIDSIRGVQLLSYDGKPLSTLRLPPTVALAYMQPHTVQMTGDVVVVAGRAGGGAIGGGGVIHVLDALQGRKVSESISHPHEVVQLACSQSGPLEERCVAFIDRHRELFVCSLSRNAVSSPSSSTLTPLRVASNVDDCRWNDSHEVLSCISEGQVRAFFLPHAHAIDPDCAAHTTATLSASHAHSAAPAAASHSSPSSQSSTLGSRSSLLSFSRSLLTLRTSSGTQLALHCPPYPLFLHRCASNGEWSRALRLCRLLSSSSSDDARLCWAVLYGLAVQAMELEVAAQSAAVLDWPDKARQLSLISRIPSEAGRRGSLCAYMRRFERAEAVFLAAQLPLRAVQLHLDRFHFTQALATAKKANAHIDTVLLARRTHLQLMQAQARVHARAERGEAGGGEAAGEEEESLPEFLAMQAVQVDAQAVQAKVAAEWRKEEAKQQPYQSTIRCRTQHLADMLALSDEGKSTLGPTAEVPTTTAGVSHDDVHAGVEHGL